MVLFMMVLFMMLIMMVSFMISCSPPIFSEKINSFCKCSILPIILSLVFSSLFTSFFAGMFTGNKESVHCQVFYGLRKKSCLSFKCLS